MDWQSPLPDHISVYRDLFKYRALHMDVLDYKGHIRHEPSQFTKSIFEKRSLYFAAPASFNDPFDCNIRMRTDRLPAYIPDRARAEIKRSSPEISAEQIEAAITALEKNPQMLDHIFDAKRKHIYEQSSVFCWGGTGESISMFAYYADSHKGICLQFKIEHRHPLGQTVPIRYPEAYPILNYADQAGDPDLSRHLMFTKAKCWEHEQECRVFRYGVPAGPVDFMPDQLIRVIFGFRCADVDVRLVENWLAGWPSSVILARSKPREGAFELYTEDFATAGGVSAP